MHNMNYAHLDIKEENIIVNDELNVQLIDFGVSKNLDETQEPMHGQCGTVDHMAPEMFRRKRYLIIVVLHHY